MAEDALDGFAERSLRAVAYLQITFGWLAVVQVAWVLLVEREVSLNFGVIGVWIGRGLLERRESWRHWAVTWLTLGMVLLAYALLAFALGPAGVPVKLLGEPRGYMSHWWVVAMVLGLGAIDAWSLWVLSRPDVRALFRANPVPSA